MSTTPAPEHNSSEATSQSTPPEANNPEANNVVRYEVQDGVATITLNRPQALNALTDEAKVALLEAIRTADEDSAVRVLVLTGQGRAFCVGQDLREHVASLNAAESRSLNTVREHYNPIALALADLRKPSIAAVNGVTAGAGLSLAMLTDVRIACESATFTTAFAGIALSCDTGASWTLQRLVGPTKAMEMLFNPRSIDAAEAERLGLVTTVSPDDEFAATVGAVARQLAAGPTLAYASIRAAVHFSSTHSLAESLDFEADKMALTGDSADHHAAVKAFLAKEQPQFSGK